MTSFESFDLFEYFVASRSTASSSSWQAVLVVVDFRVRSAYSVLPR